MSNLFQTRIPEEAPDAITPSSPRHTQTLWNTRSLSARRKVRIGVNNVLADIKKVLVKLS